MSHVRRAAGRAPIDGPIVDAPDEIEVEAVKTAPQQLGVLLAAPRPPGQIFLVIVQAVLSVAPPGRGPQVDVIQCNLSTHDMLSLGLLTRDAQTATERLERTRPASCIGWPWFCVSSCRLTFLLRRITRKTRWIPAGRCRRGNCPCERGPRVCGRLPGRSQPAVRS